MTRQDKLQLQYEDAVFALLVDDAAQAEGEELLALNERLKANPDAAVPEELDIKCREAIRDAFRKEQAKKRAVSFKKTAKLLLTAALIAAVLFTVAYAAVPEFQVMVKNLVLTLTETDDSTHMGLRPGNDPNSSSLSDVTPYSIPEVQDGYTLVEEYCFDKPTYRLYWYESDDGNYYTVQLIASNETAVVSVDTENAQSVTDIVINGYSGIRVLKNGTVHIVLADTDRSVFIAVFASALPEEQVIEMARAIRYVPPEAAVSPENTGVYRYSLPQIPDGYTLIEEYGFEYPTYRAYWYEASDGNHITVSIESSNKSEVVSVDTESAQSVTDIVINGYSGICVLKDGTVQIVWADTDRSVFLAIFASDLPEEQVVKMAQAIRYVEPQQ